MRSFAIAAAILAVSAGCAMTPDHVSASREQMEIELLQLSGLAGQLEHQKDLARQQAPQVAAQIIAEMERQLPEIPPHFRDVMESETLKLQEAYLDAWTVDEAMVEIRRLYASRFTDDELQALIDHYRSPLGAKDREISGAAISEWTVWLSSRTNDAVVQANQDFFRRLQFHFDDLRRTR